MKNKLRNEADDQWRKSNQLKTAAQIAELLQVSKSRVWEMTRQKILPAIHLSRQIRFDPKAIDEWIARGGNNGEKLSDQTLLSEQTKKEEKL